MDSKGLIGYTGFIGSILRLSDCINFDCFFNKNNVNTITKYSFDLIICAAPTGNRIEVQKNSVNDLEMILFLIDHLRKTEIKKFVLISTIDTLARPNTRYGMNRKILECWIKNNLTNYCIIRLPTLIHPNIKKNILYDLKHQQWLEKINLQAINQYYDLTRLHKDIDYALQNNIKELNLFSEPISNQEIKDKFFPRLPNTFNPSAGQKYNIYPQQFTKAEIFASMEKYFNEVPLHLW